MTMLKSVAAMIRDKEAPMQMVATLPELVKAAKEHFISHLAGTDRMGMSSLLERLEKTSFFKDPASINYHSAHDGGLLLHSVGVHCLLKDIVSIVGNHPPLTPNTIAISALLHDICKIGCYEVKEKFRKDKNDRWEKYPGYEWVEESFPFGHGEKSVDLISRYIDLTEQEKLLIRWHMGPMTTGDGNDFYKICARFPEVALLHSADLMHSKVFEPQKVIEPLVGIL